MVHPVWLVQTIPPAETPVSLAEAKLYLGVDFSEHDAMITTIINAATGELDGKDGVLGRTLVTQTWRADYDQFPADDEYLRLPLFPVQSVTTLAYWDVDDADQVFTDYDLLMDSEGAYLRLATDAAWPSSYVRSDAVRVTFVAGYGAAAAVPAQLKQAVLLRVGDLYQNREATVDNTVEINPTHRSLIMPYWRPFV